MAEALPGAEIDTTLLNRFEGTEGQSLRVYRGEAAPKWEMVEEEEATERRRGARRRPLARRRRRPARSASRAPQRQRTTEEEEEAPPGQTFQVVAFDSRTGQVVTQTTGSYRADGMIPKSVLGDAGEHLEQLYKIMEDRAVHSATSRAGVK